MTIQNPHIILMSAGMGILLAGVGFYYIVKGVAFVLAWKAQQETKDE